MVQPPSLFRQSSLPRLSFPVLSELLLGLVFVEFASERGYETAGTARRHRTQSGCGQPRNEQLAYVACCLSRRPRTGDPDAHRFYC